MPSLIFRDVSVDCAGRLQRVWLGARKGTMQIIEDSEREIVVADRAPKESGAVDNSTQQAEISKVLSQSEPYHMYNGETGYRLTKLQYEKLLKLSAV